MKIENLPFKTESVYLLDLYSNISFS